MDLVGYSYAFHEVLVNRATTSAGVAWSLGYQDGNNMPARLQARLADEIVKAVKVPVSLDFESGYSDKPLKRRVETPVVVGFRACCSIANGCPSLRLMPAALSAKVSATVYAPCAFL